MCVISNFSPLQRLFIRFNVISKFSNGCSFVSFSFSRTAFRGWLTEKNDGERLENFLNVGRFEFVHDEKQRHHTDGDENPDSRASSGRLAVEVTARNRDKKKNKSDRTTMRHP